MDHSLVCQVKDEDGDPLLIESADYLPKWLNPESSLNRVYIYQGQVHIIPRREKSDRMTVKEALKMLQQDSNTSRCKEEIQKCIQSRVSNFPKAIKEQKHRARCFVPASVAVLLENHSGLVSHAVRAFYLRDDYDMKACRLMKYFPPENRVFRNVTFTKCLYAQLLSQKFLPDVKIGWNIPPVNSPQFKSYDLGMKLACGFEILISKAKSVTSDYVNHDNCCEDKWKQFVNSLKDKGYFNGLLVSSKGYQERLANAYEFYQQSMKLDDNTFEDSSQIGLKILNLVKSLEIDYEKLKQEEEHLESEDDDNWINIDQEKFENILQNQFKGRDLTTELAKKIPKALDSFVNYDKSGLDGAEFPKNQKTQERLKPVQFNPDNIQEALSSILSLKIPKDDDNDEDDDDSSALSDYDQNDIDDDLFDSDDDDYDLKLLKLNPTRPEVEKQSSKDRKEMEYIQEMKMYMKAMDEELSKTEIDKSFEKELKVSNVNKVPPLATVETDSDDDDASVNTSVNTLKNILQSYDCQQGLAGPASNILSSMGLHLPKNTGPSS